MAWMDRYLNVSVLKGKTLTKVSISEDKSEVYLSTSDGLNYKMYHKQDCCEDVHLRDVAGELAWIIGEPLVEADEETSEDSEDYDHVTWTFYKFRTKNGFVTFRWYGSSNGYYSESVDLILLDS